MVDTEDKEQDSPTTKTATGMDPNVAGLLCYLFGWVSGLIFYLIEKDDKKIRFHALQSILLSVATFAIWIAIGIVFSILGFIPGISLVAIVVFPLLYAVLGLGIMVIWIMLMVKAYQGEKWKLPIIGDIAEKNA